MSPVSGEWTPGWTAVDSAGGGTGGRGAEKPAPQRTGTPVTQEAEHGELSSHGLGIPSHGDQGDFGGQLGPWAPGLSEEILLGARAPGRQQTNIRLPYPQRPPPGSAGWGQATGQMEQAWKGSGLAGGSGDPSATLYSPELWSGGGDPVGDRPAVTLTHTQVQLQESLTSVLGPQTLGEPRAPAR